VLYIFFTARFAQGAKFAEEKYIFFSADPGGIGFAFHRAGRAENKYAYAKTIAWPFKAYILTDIIVQLP